MRRMFLLAGGPSVLVSDRFERADAAGSLGTAETGQAWDPVSGTWGVAGTQAYKSASGGDGYNNCAIDAGAADCVVGVRITQFSPSDPGFQGLCCRLSDDGNYLRCLFYPAGYLLGRRDAGSFYTLAAGSWISGALAAGELVEVRLAGSTIRILRGGVEEVALSSTFNQSATRHGLHSYYADVRFDDFAVRRL